MELQGAGALRVEVADVGGEAAEVNREEWRRRVDSEPMMSMNENGETVSSLLRMRL